MMRLDHLAVSCRALAEGAAHVEMALGVPPGPGGRHDLMGTHNLLLGMGDVYLEVIAADPDAPPPGWPRWFSLDGFDGPPRLTNWIAACDDLDAEIGRGPDGVGHPMALKRGALRWRMAVPPDGALPFDDAFPALIGWEGSLHPTRMLPDVGLRLRGLEITHPRAPELRAALRERLDDQRVVFTDGPVQAIRAEVITPSGLRVLA